MKKVLPLFILSFFINTCIFASESKKNINLSLGESSLIMLNFSHDKWTDDRLKFGLEGNLINRNIASITQNVLDAKVYTGWEVIKGEDVAIDVRIGYGVNLAYFPLNNTTAFGYAPVIGTNLKYDLSPKWILNCKLMGSFYQDGVAIPYLLGVNHTFGSKNVFLGLQGICGLNFGNQITSNLETGICIGIEL